MDRNKHYPYNKFAGLVCPETKLPLEVANQATLSVINERIKNRQLKGWYVFSSIYNHLILPTSTAI